MTGNRPNILFFYPDQWRADWTGFRDGIGIRTPNLARMASRGVRFTGAICPSPLCAPARACLASGREYHRARVESNRESYPLDQLTFYQMLRDTGYSVLGCGKFDLHKPEFTWGSDGAHLLTEWGFTGGIDSEGKLDGVNAYRLGRPGPYLDYLRSRGVDGAYIADMNLRRASGNKSGHLSPLSDEEYGDNWVAKNGLDLLRNAPDDRPWFLQINFPGPHSPFDITTTMDRWYHEEEMPVAYGGCTMAPEKLQTLRKNYSAMCENIDRRMGDFLDYLNENRTLENTLIIFSADHGEMLGDRDRWGKSLPYAPSLRVPLIVVGPGVAGGPGREAGRTVGGAVTNLDITATILDAAGLEVPATMDSRSLRPTLRGDESSIRDCVTSALSDGEYHWRAAIVDHLKLVRHANGLNELYRWQDDPAESTDLALDMPEEIERLAAALPPIANTGGNT